MRLEPKIEEMRSILSQQCLLNFKQNAIRELRSQNSNIEFIRTRKTNEHYQSVSVSIVLDYLFCFCKDGTNVVKYRFILIASPIYYSKIEENLQTIIFILFRNQLNYFFSGCWTKWYLMFLILQTLLFGKMINGELSQEKINLFFVRNLKLFTLFLDLNINNLKFKISVEGFIMITCTIVAFQFSSPLGSYSMETWKASTISFLPIYHGYLWQI